MTEQKIVKKLAKKRRTIEFLLGKGTRNIVIYDEDTAVRITSYALAVYGSDQCWNIYSADNPPEKKLYLLFNNKLLQGVVSDIDGNEEFAGQALFLWQEEGSSKCSGIVLSGKDEKYEAFRWDSTDFIFRKGGKQIMQCMLELLRKMATIPESDKLNELLALPGAMTGGEKNG